VQVDEFEQADGQSGAAAVNAATVNAGKYVHAVRRELHEGKKIVGGVQEGMLRARILR